MIGAAFILHQLCVIFVFMEKEKLKIGDVVKMSESCKIMLNSNGSHEHVTEFGECTGVVAEEDDDMLTMDEVEIRWYPSGLKYCYPMSSLDIQEKVHLSVFVKNLSLKDIESAAIAYLKWQESGNIVYIKTSVIYRLCCMYFLPLGAPLMEGISTAHHTILSELTKRIYSTKEYRLDTGTYVYHSIGTNHDNSDDVAVLYSEDLTSAVKKFREFYVNASEDNVFKIETNREGYVQDIHIVSDY